MAFIDLSLQLSSAQAITTTAASTNIYDITGAGSGNAPNQEFGNATVFGADIGAGDGVAMPTVYVDVTTAFQTGDGATLTIALQAAIDNGSNAPGSYTTLLSTGVFAASVLTASNRLLTFQIPPLTLGQSLPRFYRLYYTVGTGTFSAGALTAGIAFNLPAGVGGTLYPANYTVYTV